MRFRSSWFALAVALPAALAAQGSAPLEAIRTFRLPNGLTVVLAPDLTARHVAAELWIAAGSRDDPPGRRGLAHLFEHASANAAARIDTAVSNAARPRVANGNAQVLREFSRFYLQVDPSALDYALAVHAGRLSLDSTAFSAEAVRGHQNIVVNEQRNGVRFSVLPGWSLGARLAANGYGEGHPYALVPETEAGVRGLGPDDLQRWLRERHAADHAMLLLVGRFDVAAAESLVTARFARLAPGAATVAAPGAVPAVPTFTREVLVSDRVAPSVQRLVVVPPFGDPAGDAAELAARLVARRWVALAGDALAGPATVGLQPGRLASDLTIAAPVRDAARAERLLAQAIADAAAGRLDADLSAARLAARAALLTSLDRLGFIGSRTEQIGWGMLFTGDPAYAARRLDRFATLPAPQIAAAARWFVGRGAQIVTAHPAAGGDAGAVTLGAVAAAALPVPHDTTVADLRVVTIPRAGLPMVRVAATLRHDGDAALRTTFDRFAALAARGAVVPEVATGTASSTVALTLPADALAEWGRILADAALPRRRTLLTFGGALGPREALALAAPLLARWPAGTAPAAFRAVSGAALVPGDSLVTVPDRAQVRLRAEWALPGRDAADAMTLRLLDRLLLRAFNADLRERRGWSYGASSTQRQVGDSVVLAFEMEIQPDRGVEAVAALRALATDFHRGAGAPPDMERLREGLRQEILSGHETVADVERAVRTAVLAGRSAAWTAAEAAAVEGVDAARLAAARALVAPARMRLTVTGDPARLPR